MALSRHCAVSKQAIQQVMSLGYTQKCVEKQRVLGTMSEIFRKMLNFTLCRKLLKNTVQMQIEICKSIF